MRISSRNCGRWLAIAMGAVSLNLVSQAFASNEPLGLGDTRSMGMGGTGTSFLLTPSVASRNPALLQGTDFATLYFGISPALPLWRTPVDGPNQEKNLDFALFAIPALAASMRLHERVVVGLAVNAAGGSAGTYSNAKLFGGKDLSALSISAEVVPAVSVKILENLWLGASYRVSYLSSTVKVPQMAETGAYEISKTSTDKIYAGAYGLGVYYEPIQHLKLGAAFRSQILATGHGDTTFNGSKFRTSQTVSSPASIRGGVSYGFMNDRLLTALEMRWEFYSQSNRELVTRIYTPAGRMESITPQRWRDSFNIQVGGEYWMDEARSWCLRAGYAGGPDPVRKERPNFYPSGGIFHQLTVGMGAKAGNHWQIDGAFMAELPHGFTSKAPRADAGAPPGEYSKGGFLLSVAGTYFFGGRPAVR